MNDAETLFGVFNYVNNNAVPKYFLAASPTASPDNQEYHVKMMPIDLQVPRLVVLRGDQLIVIEATTKPTWTEFNAATGECLGTGSCMTGLYAFDPNGLGSDGDLWNVVRRKVQEIRRVDDPASVDPQREVSRALFLWLYLPSLIPDDSKKLEQSFHQQLKYDHLKLRFNYVGKHGLQAEQKVEDDWVRITTQQALTLMITS